MYPNIVDVVPINKERNIKPNEDKGKEQTYENDHEDHDTNYHEDHDTPLPIGPEYGLEYIFLNSRRGNKYYNQHPKNIYQK